MVGIWNLRLKADQRKYGHQDAPLQGYGCYRLQWVFEHSQWVDKFFASHHTSCNPNFPIIVEDGCHQQTLVKGNKDGNGNGWFKKTTIPNADSTWFHLYNLPSNY